MGRLCSIGLLFAVIGLGLAGSPPVLADAAPDTAAAPAREPVCINGFSRGFWTCQGARAAVRLETGQGQVLCVNSYGPEATACDMPLLPASTARNEDGAHCLNGYGSLAPCPAPRWGNDF